MTYWIHNCIIEMVRHWPPCAILERSSCFMYEGKLSLYTSNTVASHDTCKGLRKSYGMINVIRYRGSTSGSTSTPYLSYTINKHKLMTINTLLVTNPFFLIIFRNNKMKYMFWKMFYKMCRPSKEGIKCLPH